MSEKLKLSQPQVIQRQALLSGPIAYRLTGKFVSPLLRTVVDNAAYKNADEQLAIESYVSDLAKALSGQRLGLFAVSGILELEQVILAMESIQPLLAERAWILVDNADFTSVYDGLKGVVLNNPAFRFEEIHIDYTHGSRAGQGVALLSFESVRTAAQLSDEIPVSKNKQLADRFIASTPLLEKQRASSIVDQALVKWVPISDARSDEVFKTLQIEFPDGASPKTYWHEAYKLGFTDFFAWGHDQDFGFGRTRQGTMSTRHVEIVSESIEYGYLPERLTDLDVLDVGCWTGGDVLALAGMGARVTALEEHPISAAAAKRMCDLLGVSAEVHSRSLYSENSEWMGKFDVVYISGVIYHVTDPVLALRICFAYLKPGGRIVVETKASKLEGALCEYGGTHEKGWNWYSPTLETFGRWLVDAGFPRDQVRVHMRPVGRLLAGAVKGGPKKLPERAGFSRPNSWLESAI